MKETELQTRPLSAVEIKEQKQAEKQHKLVARLFPHRGHTGFKVNKETLEVSKINYEIEQVDYKAALNGEIAPKRKVVVEDGYFYCFALNEKNALKKFHKQNSPK